ncbi:armadillo-type protein [Aspergillus pseudoustus]|uniref:Armadillo-type protein n=1 Tax=Aspergillus pseudoustus TaxID=1810923 RepID=A0ABR4K306_9EURO
MTSVAFDDYTVAWICALPMEATAARAMLDQIHTPPQRSTDHNAYELGELNGHYVVIVLLPEYGTVAAAHAVSDILRTFPRIRFGFGLMVGIGGGVPGKQNDIRLGDVVVSKPGEQHSGVIQYAYGKRIPGGFKQTGTLNKPPPILLAHVGQLQAKHMDGKEVLQVMQRVLEGDPSMKMLFSPPEYNTDYLFHSSYRHAGRDNDCEKCDKQQLVPRNPRDTRAPHIHYGLIASADQVMKDSDTRDRLAQEHGILCFEMEAAGLMDKLPTLVIRGICDYSDSHKQKQWQGYAALTAAAYAELLLSNIPVEDGTGARSRQVDIKLREYYETGDLLKIKRLSGKSLDMEQCYINLSIIEHQQQNQDTMSRPQPPSSGFSLLNRLKIAADTPEKEVTLPDLFRDRKLPDGRLIQPNRILIQGRAGVGKTTLCKKIVHDFYHQKMWGTLFDRVVWIPLRKLKGKSTLDKFFHQEYFSFEAERDNLVSKLSKMVLDQTHKRTLWLLDGLDEISGTGLIETFSRLLNQYNVIITSRPYAVNISGLASFDLELETVGFHPRQVQTYLAKVMKDPNTADQVHTFIRSHWLIQGLVRIPIQLDALCYSWDKSNLKSNALPQTMTQIYQAIELKLWIKDILNFEKRDRTGQLMVGQKLGTRAQIQLNMETEMRFLECLAFTGLYNDIVDFHPDHRDWLYEQQFPGMSDHDLDRLSFLRTSDTSSQGESYHFIHLTFQEFFAAQYFVRCFISKSCDQLLCLQSDHLRGKCLIEVLPEKFLQETKYSGRYDVFWRFVTGLLHKISKDQVCSFLKKIEGEPHDLLGPAHQRLLMHCFSEIPQPENSGLADDSNVYLRHLREKMEHGCIQWSKYEDRWLPEMRLCSETEFPDHILCELLEKNFLQRRSSHRKKILEALAHRWHISPKLMGITANFMDDSDEGVRRAAVEALGSQSPWPPEVLQAVMGWLDDSNKDVRRAVVKALGSQSPWPPEILQAVMGRLDNSDWVVRREAVEALGSQSPWPPEVLQAVMGRLDDSDWVVRREAVEALCSQSPWPPEVLQVVMGRLDNSDEDVRRAAVKALGSQCPWPPEILQAVMGRLDNSNEDVRRAAVEALGSQSPWPPEILQAVMGRLDDSNEDVRRAVVEALGSQSPWPPEILQAVMGRLDDSDWVVRRAVVEALGSQPPWPPEILQAVMGRLDDSDEDVRRGAVEALGSQSPWPPEVLQTVMGRLDDSDEAVRRGAVEALGSQSPWPPEILQAVMGRLDDSDWVVRREAVEALGSQSPWPPEILQAVMGRLDDSDWVVRRAAVKALGSQSPYPPEILQAVMGCLDDSDEDVRRVVVEALGSQSPWPPEILQAVMGRLDNSNKDVRRAAVEALGSQSPWPPEILQTVMGRLDDSDEAVRRAAVKALGSQSPWPPEILQAVMGRLNDSNKDVRRAVVKALGSQSPWPPEILQAVMGRLDDSDWVMRRGAVEALGSQSPWPPEILQAVMGRLDDSKLASGLEALLWKHDNIPSLFLQLHPDAAAATLCRIWTRKSIQETFVCYARDGNIYFEMPDGRKAFSASRKDIQLFKDRLWAATLHSPILRLVYKDGTPFSGLRD